MRTAVFWRETTERAVKSAAQALLGLWPLDQFNILNADPRLAGGIAAGAAVLSILTSLASTAIGSTSSPSVVE
ncbi:hypothetical protein FHR83_007005 [Actinoplanes campanulatus]|uniref:Holin n=1 Tax=Actinoplanes campanulatus TaxID=113559 RepID=A0A7W5AP03_9ACTN|nr:holin [Actinoplanes campanulatus]MBB3099299.1 hypothetical protein [Actinoplanes campanulatus]GID40617.1 hypothetical protein Aca09nite_71230 [Actinoplanes campanulatus]